MNKILLGSIAFVGLYNLFFYPTVVGIGLGILCALAHTYLYFVRAHPSKNLSLALALSALSVFFATAVGVRSNEEVQVIDVMLSVSLVVLAGYFYKKKDAFSWEIFSFLLTPLWALKEEIESVRGFFTHNSVTTHTQSNKAIYGAIFRGVLIAVPILFVLYKLLSGADPIFAKLLGNMSLSLSWQLIISLVLFAIAFFWGIATVKEKGVVKNEETSAITGNQTVAIETLVVTLSAALLFALFLYVQIQYLFLQVPETQLQHLGINIQTYSQYVRQGFFQLLVAAAIATSIIGYGLKTVHTIVQKRQIYLKLGMVLLSLETEFLLVSAARRVYLYVGAHGLTSSRVYGTIFLLWLFVVLLLMIYVVVKNIQKAYFFLSLLVITSVAFVWVNVMPVESLVATTYPPTINGEVDYVYLSSLSPDAAVFWPSFIQHSENTWLTLSQPNVPTTDQWQRVEDLRHSLSLLDRKVFYLDHKYATDSKKYIVFYSDVGTARKTRTPRSDANIARGWQAFNLSEYQAYLLIQQNRPMFEKLQILEDSIQDRKEVWTRQNQKTK